MGRVRRQLRGRSKLITIWVVLLGVVLAAKSEQFIDSIPTLEALLESYYIPFRLYWWGGAALLGLLLFKKLFGRLLTRTESGFKDNPFYYEKQAIRLYGRVEHILKDNFTEKMKRRSKDAFRTLVGNDDPVGRYVHQRFVISSPQLRKGENIIVFHNIKYGKLKLRKKQWLELQGEYIHVPSVRKSVFGPKKTFYGRIHHTHEPKGFVEVIGSKPAEAEYKKVIIVGETEPLKDAA